MRELFERGFGNADVETLGEFRFQLERGNDRDQVGIAASLAKAVERSLDLACAGANSGKRICDRLLRIVVSVDPHMVARNDLYDLTDNAFNLVGERTAVGIAKDDPTRTFVICSPGTGERKFRIGLIAIEEMFAIEQHFPALRLCGANALADRREVLF